MRMVGDVSYPTTRAFKRRGLSIKVGVSSPGTFHLERAVEIGEGGMLLHSESNLGIGDELELSFCMPGGAFVSARGRVIYAREPEPGHRWFGIAFLDPSSILRFEVRRYVHGG